MAREAEGYRDALAYLESRIPGKTVFTAQDVADVTGLNVKTVRDRYGIGKNGIFITELARKLCK